MNKSVFCLLFVLPLILQAQVPKVVSFSPQQGPIGTTVNLSGINFHSTPEENVVFFGGVQATVSAASTDELVVVVPVGASYGFISVLANGLTGYATEPFMVTFESSNTFSTSPGSFDTSTSTSASGGPYVVAPADFDNDGKVDLIAGNFDDEDFSLYLNASSGVGSIEFAAPMIQSFGLGAYEFAVADFNNDGKMDLAAGGLQGSGGMVVVLENSFGGTNAFEIRETRSSLTNEVNSVATGDFNQDGKVDLVYAGGGSTTTVTVMENTSSGVIDMKAGTDYTVGNTPYKVVVADMDQDGLPDIVALNQDDNSFSILKNISSGGMIAFDAKVDFAINSSTNSEWVAIGDVNGEGLPDIIVRNVTSISVFENKSSSNLAFGTPLVLTANTNAGIVSMDDFNGDGRLDLMISTFNGLDVFANTSDASAISFDNAVTFSMPPLRTPSFAGSADMDGDGEPDLVTTSSDFLGGGHVEVLRNKHSANDFVQFSFPSQTSPGSIDAINHTISIEVTNIPDLTNLVATYETSYGVTVEVAGVVQTSAVTPNDYSSSVTYSLTAEDGSTQDWTVTTTLNCTSHEVTESLEVCGNYEFDGKTLTESGTYTAGFTNSAGCDSTVTLNLSIIQNEFIHNIYSEGSYDFNGTILSASGQYHGSFARSSGCDSLVTLNLTISTEEDPYVFFELLLPEGSPQLQADFANLGGVIVSEDLDGDGDNDVVVSGISNNTGEFPSSVGYGTVIYWNDGKGHFTREESLLAELSAWVEIADFDQDGDKDVLLVGSSLNSFYVTTLLLNDGAGNFSEHLSHGLPGFRAGSVEIVDLDQTNGPDVVLQGITEDGDYIAGIYYNTGSGTFLKYDQSTLTGLWGGQSVGGDLDNDGDLDLVMTGRDISKAPQLFVYINENGKYVSSSTTGLLLPTSHGRELIQLIDKNHDGAWDLIIGTYFFLNDGSGKFLMQTVDITGDIERPWALDTGDINDDGWTDLMVSGSDDTSTPFEVVTQLFLGNASGDLSFTQEVEGVVAGAAILKDVNGDEYPDLLTSGYVNDSFTAEVEVFINDGTGGMTKNTLEPIGVELADGDAHFHDFDKDGDQDLIVGGSNEEGKFKTIIYWNDGSGNFTEDVSNSFAGTKYNILLEDFNGDGEIDIITTRHKGNRLYLGDGMGNFVEKTDANLGKNAEPFGAVADIDNDADKDLIIIGSTNSGILRNDGSGVFTLESGPFIDMYSSKVVFGDVDNDSDQDVFIVGDPRASGLPHQAIIYLNDGLGNFVEDNRNSFQGFSNPIASFADIDKDGDMDLFYGGKYGSAPESMLFFNDGTGQFIRDTASEIVSAYSGESEFSDLDGDGDMDLLITGHNHQTRGNQGAIYWNNGWGHFQLDTVNNLIGLNHSMLAVGDVDGNGVNEIFISGADNGKQSRIYRNTLCQSISEELEVEALGSYEFYGELLTSSGTYTHSEPLRCGKSNVTTLVLTIIEISGKETAESCHSYEWNGKFYTETGTYQEVFQNAAGLDSTVTLHLTILESTTSETEVTVCNSYEWNGVTYDTSGTYSELFTNAAGCDSTATLNLKILEPTSGEDEVEACESYEWEGTIYTTSGAYSEVLTNAAGCDSVATLTLTILESTSGDQIVQSCESYEWEGTLYETSGIYEKIFTNAKGCDSTAVLDLTILSADEVHETITTCDSYEFDDQLLNTSGQYSAILTNELGCDSLVSLELTIMESEEVFVNVDACGSYPFGEQLITESGTYQEKFLSTQGCDSLVNLTVGMLEEPDAGIELNGRVLFATDNSSGLTYQWYDCDSGELLQGEDKRQLTPPRAGNYFVEIANTVCQVESICFEVAEEDILLNTDWAFSNMQIYPNPSNGPIQLTWEQPRTIEITVIGLAGRIVKQETYDHKEEITLSIDAAGLYLIRIRDLETGIITDHKVQVR